MFEVALEDERAVGRIRFHDDQDGGLAEPALGGQQDALTFQCVPEPRDERLSADDLFGRGRAAAVRPPWREIGPVHALSSSFWLADSYKHRDRSLDPSYWRTLYNVSFVQCNRCTKNISY